MGTDKEGALTTAQPPGPFVLVASRLPQGFRRAGRFWPAAPTRVALTDMTDEQLAQLVAEPMLDTRMVRPECTDTSVATDSAGGQLVRVERDDAPEPDVVQPAAEDPPAADAPAAKPARRPKAAA